MAIQVNAILQSDNAYSPEIIPLSFGNYFDGEFFYFFESIEECKIWQETHETPTNINKL